MNKAEFIMAVAEKTALKRQEVETIFVGFWDVITEQLAKGKSVNFVGLGSLVTKERSACNGHDLKTGKALAIATKIMSQFKAGAKLKETIGK